MDTVNARTPADVVIAQSAGDRQSHQGGQGRGHPRRFRPRRHRRRRQGGRAQAAAAQHRRFRPHAAQRQVDRLFDGRLGPDGRQHHQETLVSPRSSRRGRSSSTASRPPRRWRAARSRSRCSRSTSSCRSRAPSSAGALPPELQQYNHFAVGVLAVSKEREVATAMVKFMGAPENEALVRKSGLEPPAR